jgi:hypothetical protein
MAHALQEKQLGCWTYVSTHILVANNSHNQLRFAHSFVWRFHHRKYNSLLNMLKTEQPILFQMVRIPLVIQDIF